ncbi:hypothetical protein H6G27_24085 [Nostoc linckia FACHB-104]|nr:hypothetical protein [Nostoc linckia FACHB-104]
MPLTMRQWCRLRERAPHGPKRICTASLMRGAPALSFKPEPPHAPLR